MSTAPARPRTLLTLAAVAASAALALTGCGSSASSGSSASPSNSGASTPAGSSSAGSTGAGDAQVQGWPRTIKHAKGETVIEKKPENIASTSITLTGSLLAIDAPVKTSAATKVTEITGKQGFFGQWADVAQERGVEVLYPNLEFDEEALLAADPDLIVVSSTGADSTADQYEKLSDIAPTIVLDYGGSSWQDLSKQLAEATGQEAKAEEVVASYDKRVSEAKTAIGADGQSANVVVWNGTSEDTAFAKEGSAHADLIESLGYKVVGADDAFDVSPTARKDFAFVSIENTVKALGADNVFVASGDDSVAQELKKTKVLENAPAVKADKVTALGKNSFRIDYFSALEIIEQVQGARS